MTVSIKEVASLGIVMVVALLFLALITTLRPSAIAPVPGDEVINVAPRKHTLAHSEGTTQMPELIG
jgi:hypothetical protein